MPLRVICSISNRQWVRPSFSWALRAASSVVDCPSLLDAFSPWCLRSKATSSGLGRRLDTALVRQALKHFLMALAPVLALNGASWPHSPPRQRRRSLIFAIKQTGFFQNAQHKDKQLVVYLQRQAPPDGAQGGVVGHNFTGGKAGGKAQESLRGQGIASCASRCRAQSRCPQGMAPATQQRLIAWAPLCLAWRLFNELVQQQVAHRQSR